LGCPVPDPVVRCRPVRMGLAGALGGILMLSAAIGADEERVWNQRRAKKIVTLMLELEKTGKRPWNEIRWRTDPAKAIADSKRLGQPLLVFFHVEHEGPPVEACCPGGRLMRAIALSDPKVQSLVKRHFIPLKVAFRDEAGFPLDWPALGGWATAHKFSNGKGFAGCSVVSTDLQLEYGSTGSAKIWELFDSTAYDADRFAAMLERAVARHTEERALWAQRRISLAEKRAEVDRFRDGIRTAVKAESRLRLPPSGFSLEQAMELFELAGAAK